MNISPKHFLQGSSVAFLVYYLNPKLHYLKIIGIGMAAVVIFYLLDRNNITEKFSNASDETREIRYGDTITLYSDNGFYLKGPEDPSLTEAAVAISDFNIIDGIKNIPIEERNAEEVSSIYGLNSEGDIEKIKIIPDNAICKNYAFDVTPAKYITKIITEKKIVNPNQLSISELLK